MGYVESNLSKDETVVYRASIHWIVFVVPALLCLFLIGIPLLLLAILRRMTAEFAVTSKRVIIKYGLISRSTIELNLNKIESIGVNQGIFGRIFGYGTITVVGTGGTKEPFRAIADPLAFRRAVHDATENMRQPTAATSLA